jgi:hypothetical protein
MSETTDIAPDVKHDFTCYICGCHTYTELKQSNGIMGPGGRVKIISYECNKCSILFKDPKKFNEVFLLIGTLQNPNKKN